MFNGIMLLLHSKVAIKMDLFKLTGVLSEHGVMILTI